MRFNSSTSKLLILPALLLTLFLVSDASAQQECYCEDDYTTVRTVAVRRPVARTYRAKKVRKVRRATASTARVYRPAYQTTYVAVREMEYPSRYVAVEDDCDDDMYQSRVIVYDRSNAYYATDRVHTNGYIGNGSYNNGRVYSNVYNANRVYANGGYRAIAVDADYYDPYRIATDYGFRDGFRDGENDALERDDYKPERSGDFRNGTNGFEGEYGNKDMYKQSYRAAFLRGYEAGFRSIANQSGTHRIIVNP